MNNADMPASPILGDVEGFTDFIQGIKGGRNYGLTKREYFAAKAMQGLFVNMGRNRYNNIEDVAKASVEAADELLKALEES